MRYRNDMKYYEFSFPGKLFDSTVIIQATDLKEAKKILKEFILIEPTITDWSYAIEHTEFKKELGSVSNKAKLIYYFDGSY